MAKRQATKRSAGTKSTTKKVRAKAKKKPTRRPHAIRTSYAEAVAAYERGLEALQKRDYHGARDTLAAILTAFPEERELHDRVRQYLRVCERQIGQVEPKSTTVEDRLYDATVALNAGDQKTALALLEAVEADDPDNDHAVYMLGVAQAVGGNHEAGVEYLRRAIELNGDNRALARQAPELEALRSTDGFKQILDTAAASGRRARGRRSR